MSYSHPREGGILNICPGCFENNRIFHWTQQSLENHWIFHWTKQYLANHRIFYWTKQSLENHRIFSQAGTVDRCTWSHLSSYALLSCHYAGRSGSTQVHNFLKFVTFRKAKYLEKSVWWKHEKLGSDCTPRNPQTEIRENSGNTFDQLTPAVRTVA
jgi:hypothetical protein